MYRFNVSIKIEYINYEISRYVQIFSDSYSQNVVCCSKGQKIILFSRDQSGMN